MKNRTVGSRFPTSFGRIGSPTTIACGGLMRVVFSGSFSRSLLVVVGVAAGGCAPERDLQMGDLLGAPVVGAQAATVCGVGPTVKGIDVSKWQGTIDWDEVAADGVEYAIIRVSDGLGYIDEQFERNWSEAARVGLVRGTYQFFRSDEDPTAQAELLLERMGPLAPGDFPPTIDLESTDGIGNAERIRRVHTWMDRVMADVGARPFIYSGKYWWQDNMATTEFNEHPRWHAQYTSADCPNLATQWPDWQFWQHSSTGRVQGIGGGNSNVDMNRFNGDRAALDALRVGEAVCGDGRCSAGEGDGACPADCPTCEPVPAAGDVIDDTDLCFDGGGPEQFLRHVSDAGHDGGLIWTHATEQSAEDNSGHWTLSFQEAGRYKIEAYTAAAYAESTLARYRVRHAGSEDDFVVDQTAHDGWTVVADDVAFAAGGDQWVHLADNTGEALAANVRLVFDALRLTRLDAPGPGPGPGPGPSPPDEPTTEPPDPSAPGDTEQPASPTASGPRRIVLQNVPKSVQGCAAAEVGDLGGFGLLLLLRRRRRGRRDH
jgi:GH25 family lysozyme M1 (1,4-beta-N-acetylmuramidase)